MVRIEVTEETWCRAPDIGGRSTAIDSTLTELLGGACNNYYSVQSRQQLLRPSTKNNNTTMIIDAYTAITKQKNTVKLDTKRQMLRCYLLLRLLLLVLFFFFQSQII